MTMQVGQSKTKLVSSVSPPFLHACLFLDLHFTSQVPESVYWLDGNPRQLTCCVTLESTWPHWASDFSQDRKRLAHRFLGLSLALTLHLPLCSGIMWLNVPRFATHNNLRKADICNFFSALSWSPKALKSYFWSPLNIKLCSPGPLVSLPACLHTILFKTPWPSRPTNSKEEAIYKLLTGYNC